MSSLTLTALSLCMCVHTHTHTHTHEWFRNFIPSIQKLTWLHFIFKYENKSRGKQKPNRIENFSASTATSSMLRNSNGKVTHLLKISHHRNFFLNKQKTWVLAFCHCNKCLRTSAYEKERLFWLSFKGLSSWSVGSWPLGLCWKRTSWRRVNGEQSCPPYSGQKTEHPEEARVSKSSLRACAQWPNFLPLGSTSFRKL
jgi:hypothetical protein